MRPTESLTIFLQQLGRGLRLAEDKECLTVLDFIGQSHKKYRFDEKFASLLHRTRKGLYREIDHGFTSLPAGCYIQLEKQAQSVILKNIKDSLSTRAALIEKLRDYAQETKEPITAGNFADYYHISLLYLYSKTTFSSLCVAADLLPPYAIPEKDYLAKALPRIAAIDSRRWLQFLLDKLPSIANWNVTQFSELEKRMIWMFYFTFYQTIEAEDVPNTSSETLSERDKKLQTAIHKLQELSQYKTVWEEMISVLEYNMKHITFVDDSVDLNFQKKFHSKFFGSVSWFSSFSFGEIFC